MTDHEHINDIINTNTNHVTYNHTIFRESGINIIYFNAVSIRNKLDDISLFISSFNFQIDVIVMCETRLKDKETRLFNIKNYDAYHSTRNNKYRGAGCAIYIHNSFNSSQIHEQCINDQNFLVVKLIKQNLNIIAIYRPPSTNIELFYHQFEYLLNEFNNSIVVGDININLLNTSSNQTKHYKNLINTNGFAILNKIELSSATRITEESKTIIDHLMTDTTRYKINISINDLSFSDHRYILANFTTKSPTSINQNTIDQKQILNYDSIDLNNLQNNLRKIESFQNLTDILKNTIKSNTKTIYIKKN